MYLRQLEIRQRMQFLGFLHVDGAVNFGSPEFLRVREARQALEMLHSIVGEVRFEFGRFPQLPQVLHG